MGLRSRASAVDRPGLRVAPAGEVSSEAGKRAGTPVAERAGEAVMIGLPEQVVLPCVCERKVAVRALLHAYRTGAGEPFFHLASLDSLGAPRLLGHPIAEEARYQRGLARRVTECAGRVR